MLARILIFSVLIAFSLSCKPYLPKSESDKEFEKFIDKFQITYRTDQDRELHLNRFITNLQWHIVRGCINLTQCPEFSKLTWESGITKFFDLSNKEFALHLRQISIDDNCRINFNFLKYSNQDLKLPDYYILNSVISYNIFEDLTRFLVQSWWCSEIANFANHEYRTKFDFYSYDKEDEIKEILFKKGPVLIEVNATGLGKYSSGIFNPFSCPNRWGTYVIEDNLYTLILLTGWEEENGIAYWNAFSFLGENWGDGGYFKLLRNFKRTIDSENLNEEDIREESLFRSTKVLITLK